MGTHSNNTLDPGSSFARRSEFLLSASLLGVLIVVLVPLPSPLMDMLLAANLGTTILLLLVTVGVKHPLEFSVFSSLLLLLTLYRLSLNVGTTRLILLHGDAGKIVSTFGGCVVGGNLVVGLVVFLILIIIQFIVITKGASRVSEVAARFTLDALPGKQMAIDAELAAGTLDEKQARQRRGQLMREAEFYGAMDGASKFVRGDAIAGLVVTGVNLVGGIVLGVSNGLTAMEAVRRYSVLTVGDGLVSQIPALIIATATGVLVTKAASEMSLGQEIGTQVLRNARPLMTGAGIILALAITPGLPKLPFLIIAGCLAYYVRRVRRVESEDKDSEVTETPPPTVSPEEQLLDDFVQSDRACLEIGARLVPLVKSNQARGLADRIPSLRRELTGRYGFWIPPVRVRDNLQLPPESYQILINGRVIATGRVRVDQCLVINADGVALNVEGEPTYDPTFGLPATWISPSSRRRAEMAGHTVVDAAGVIITHLGEILRQYAHELLGREDLQRLLTRLRETAPTVVGEIKPDLLRESCSAPSTRAAFGGTHTDHRDPSRILESVVTHATRTKDASEITELVRQDLGRSICDRFCDEQGRLRVLILKPRLESALRSAMQDSEIVLNLQDLERLVSALHDQLRKAESTEAPIAVLTDSMLRRPLRRLVQRSLPEISIIAYGEIPRDMSIEPVHLLDYQEVFEHEKQDRQSNFEEVKFAAA